MKNDNPAIQLTPDEIRKKLGGHYTGYEANYILKMANLESIESEKKPDNDDQKSVTQETNYYKAMTLFEFDKGILLSNTVPEWFRAFGLDFSKKLQAEYQCEAQGEKSLAEVTSLNFMRTLYIQAKINSYLGIGTISETGVKYLAVLSKELDRAERHYFTSLQALRSLRMPPLEVNIKTQTAIVGQNQIVQANTNDKPI